MFCKQCGTENTEGAVFCKNCGINLSAPVQQSAPVYVAPQPDIKAPRSSNPVLNVVKNIAASPLFLVAAIAFSLQILATILSSATAGALLEGAIYELLSEFGGMDFYELYEIMETISRIGSAPFVICTIIGLIPSMLICAGLWMTYGAGVSRASDSMKTSGLTMIKVITIIELVWSCVVLGVVDILLIITIIAAASVEYMAGALVALCVFAFIIINAVVALNIVYYAKIVKSINTVKGTILTGRPSNALSGFVAVWSFIMAGFLIFSLITNFFVSALSMTAFICFGILIFKYKKEMSKLIYDEQRKINSVSVEQ